MGLNFVDTLKKILVSYWLEGPPMSKYGYCELNSFLVTWCQPILVVRTLHYNWWVQKQLLLI